MVRFEATPFIPPDLSGDRFGNCLLGEVPQSDFDSDIENVGRVDLCSSK